MTGGLLFLAGYLAGAGTVVAGIALGTWLGRHGGDL